MHTGDFLLWGMGIMGSVALFAADSAEAQHTAWWAWVLCGVVAVACIAAGWFAFARSRATTDQGTRWFRLLCVHDRLWGQPTSRQISSDRLAGGLGLSLLDATISTTTVPTTPFGRGWLGSSHATLVGVPEHAAARMPFAASGCGVWALPAAAPPAGAQVTALAEQLTVPAAPGWFVGLTDAGEPMQVHPIPGATFAVFGTAPQLRAVEGSMNWPAEIYEVRRFGGGGNATEDATAAMAAEEATAAADGADAAGNSAAKTQVLLVEIPSAARSTQHGTHHSAHRPTAQVGVGFAAAEAVLSQGRKRLQLLGQPTVDVCIAVPPVGTGTVLTHGKHREYFNFFAVTAAPATATAPAPAATATATNTAPGLTQRPKTVKSHRAQPRAHKHRFPHGSVPGAVGSPGSAASAASTDDSLPMPTGERLARVVSARSASSSSAG